MWFSVCDNVEVHEGDIFLLLCYNQKVIIISKDIFPGGSDSKESACDAGDLVLNPGLGRSPGEGNGNTLQYPGEFNGQRNLVGHGVPKSQT